VQPVHGNANKTVKPQTKPPDKQSAECPPSHRLDVVGFGERHIIAADDPDGLRLLPFTMKRDILARSAPLEKPTWEKNCVSGRVTAPEAPCHWICHRLILCPSACFRLLWQGRPGTATRLSRTASRRLDEGPYRRGVSGCQAQRPSVGIRVERDRACLSWPEACWS